MVVLLNLKRRTEVQTKDALLLLKGEADMEVKSWMPITIVLTTASVAQYRGARHLRTQQIDAISFDTRINPVILFEKEKKKNIVKS